MVFFLFFSLRYFSKHSRWYPFLVQWSITSLIKSELSRLGSYFLLLPVLLPFSRLPGMSWAWISGWWYHWLSIVVWAQVLLSRSFQVISCWFSSPLPAYPPLTGPHLVWYQSPTPALLPNPSSYLWFGLFADLPRLSSSIVSSPPQGVQLLSLPVN